VSRHTVLCNSGKVRLGIILGTWLQVCGHSTGEAV